jgi:hypothetical protein
VTDGQQRVLVNIVFKDGPNFQCEMDSQERDRLLTAFLAHVNSPATSPAGDKFGAWSGGIPQKFALDFRLVRYIY